MKAQLAVVHRGVGHLLGDVVQADIVAEVEEDGGNGDCYTQREGCIEGIERLLDVLLVEVAEGQVALLLPQDAELGTAEESQTVGALLDDVVAVE